MKANIRYFSSEIAHRGSYLKGLNCLGTVLLVELGGLSDLRMADGLMTLVDEVNLKGLSLLGREVLDLEVEGAGGVADL